jgi:hypothetical protein
MNAFRAMMLENPSTSTVGKPVEINAAVVNALIDAVSDTDLYETGERKPSPDIIATAATALTAVSIANADIAPYFGEINITWRTNDGRVKAIFGPLPNTFSVYCETVQGGRVTYNDLRQHADVDYLHSSLEWLKNPLQPHVR